ncbi:retinal dehydrogenase 1-like, partial [Diaphorina citri]|uniref:Retinal dehydrogenase 1-like n=1 Tax=Diaphorina citri TaxID=121845 RepID=A0A3Q0J3V8_DIACI
LFINNAFVDAVSGRTFPTINPATEDKIADVAEADKVNPAKTIVMLISCQHLEVFNLRAWSTKQAAVNPDTTTIYVVMRSGLLSCLSLLPKSRGQMTASGSSFSTSLSHLFIHFPPGGLFPDGPYFTYTRKEPVGIVGQIIPWNYPVLMLAWKWGPALAAGCPVLLKPAEQTPLTALYVAALTQQAGFPDGVISVLPGYGPMSYYYCFVCAGSRTYVQEDIYDTFVKKAVEKAAARKVGDPFDKSVQQGPQVDAEMFTKVLNYIKSGVEQGGKLEAGGKRKGDKGYFIEPTVFSNVTDDFKIAREEIFGPVQTIIKFKTLDEVIERANDTKYGLASGIVTTNIDTANTFAHAINAGSVWINCYQAVVPQAPFGGFKESGIGRELGKAALDEYTELKTVTTKITYK